MPGLSACRIAQWRKSALGAAIVLVVSACGSTVQWSDTIAEGGLDDAVAGDELFLREPGTDTEADEPGADAHGPGKSPDTTPDGRLTTPDGRLTTPGAHKGRSGDDTPSPTGANGRGFTDREIYIGYGTFKAVESVGRAFGTDADWGNQEAQARAIIDEINSHGGIASRKIIPVFYDFDFGRASRSQDSEGQIACERWTRDRPVFAVINQIGFSDNALTACLSGQDTPYISMVVQLRPKSMYSRYSPYLYAPHAPSIERFSSPWINRLISLGYFEGWDTNLGRRGGGASKTGILSTRYLHPDTFTRVMRQRLSRHSLPVAATFEWSGEVSSVSEEMNRAVLHFRDAGVTHVIASGPEMNYFPVAAAQQNYRPRYSLSTRNQLDIIKDLAPRGQLTGALGVGWVPARDVTNAQTPSDASTAQERCEKIMREAGQDTNNRGHLVSMVQACDGFNFLLEAIAKGQLSPQGMQRGVRSMQTLNSASTFHISFPKGRPDGANAVRDIGWADNCECFRYLSSKNHGL